MKTPLWKPSTERIEKANISRFITFVNDKYGKTISGYDDLYQWSVDAIPDFWAAVWDFTEIRASRGYDAVVEDLSAFPGTKWFPGARLNFAENLLRFSDDREAFVFHGETVMSKRMTYAELTRTVARLAKSLRELGVKPGDRVAGYMPNLIETAAAMLAATSVGAVWSSCATDIGAQAALDRLGQIEPKVLFTVNGYYYKGKVFDSLANAGRIAEGMPSLEKVVVVTYADARVDLGPIPKGVLYEDFLSVEANPPLVFEQLPFDHPVVIMFSSGTTGKPKCLVQGAGGLLINHLKELALHTDLTREDRIFYITTCSWMMWNWLISALGVGSTIVLYDGNPGHPDDRAMWRLIQDEKVTVFGTSASYINYMKAKGVVPGDDFDLTSLTQISQTGSALSAEGFEYVYEAVKADLHFNSISGGTDINGCFAAGNPISPVYAGELQAPALGMRIKAYDENGKHVLDEQGELVCEAPTPSMPLYFWNDEDGARYRSAYFDVYPNIWRHGDYIEFHSDSGGITFYGRSDAILKPSGVRIGTAEIYNRVDPFEEVADSLVIGQNWKGDQRVLLFLQMAPGCELTDDLKNRIKKTLRSQASPRHVPAMILEAPDIPYTLNMKKVESSVTNILNGRPVTNRDALKNPESLDFYEKVLADLEE